ncbi:MAG: hypothetical protein QG650_280 [Patescibacteria group bacterium]|nr:hypothetical protein [Patescibacteria group bacterium]
MKVKHRSERDVPLSGESRRPPGVFERSAFSLARFFRDKITALVTLADEVISSPAAKFIPAAVFATTFATTAELWRNENNSIKKDVVRETVQASADIERSIRERMNAYEQVLR